MDLSQALERITELEQEVSDLKDKLEEVLSHASDAYDSLRKIV